jgi:hypothetical protein
VGERSGRRLGGGAAWVGGYIYTYTSNWVRVTHTCKILKLENMDDDGCYAQLYFSMINCQVLDHLICSLYS